ncbi:MAG: PEGA domain-containing protein [Kiritimatiellaeota bacterium]|nr:PEGA domain-containing protein [Kiritimatiellota bacterium]
MKKQLLKMLASVALTSVALAADPMRVAVMDFDDQTGQRADARLGGGVAPAALTAKGAFLVGQKLLGNKAFTLIDRRDFIAQMEKEQPTNQGKPTAARPTFIHAAQALRADAVLRGSLMSLSTGKETINLGGNRTEFTALNVRVGLEALNPVDGAVIAMTSGVAQMRVRQTAAQSTELSEDDVLGLMEKAIDDALPKLSTALTQAQLAQQERPRIKISVKTTADPALVEVDGILIGTTPLVNAEIFKGDHVLTIGKAGYRDMSKRILFEKATSIEVPMIRTELSADEIKQIYEKARLNIFQGEPGLIINTISN